jgi:hypothetical protein
LWYMVPIAKHFREFFYLGSLGTAGGLVMLAFRHAFSVLSPIAESVENNEYFLRGSPTLWVLVFLTGGIVEECFQQGIDGRAD